MSGLFSAPKMPAAPGPDPELLRRQQDQEARLEAQERQSAEEIAARKRARRSAGNRQLIFGMRENPYEGVPEQSTFGPTFSRESQGMTV